MITCIAKNHQTDMSGIHRRHLYNSLLTPK